MLTIDGALYWSQYVQRPWQGAIPASHFPGAMSTALRATWGHYARRRGGFKQGQVQTLQVTLVALATSVWERLEVCLGAHDATSIIVVVILFLTQGQWLWRRGRTGGGGRVQIVAPGSTHSAGIALRRTGHSQNLPFFWKRHDGRCIYCCYTAAG
jgi:hypothetical protein